MHASISRRSVMLGSAAASIAAVTPLTGKAATDPMAAEKESVQRYFDEVLTQGNLDVLNEIFSPDYEASNPDFAPGIDAYRERIANLRGMIASVVTDPVYSTESMVAENSTVMVRGLVSGIGSGMKIEASMFFEALFRDGLIVTTWSLFNENALLGG